MKRFLFCILSLWLFSLSCHAAQLKGTVSDKADNESLPYATVELLRTDSTFIKGIACSDQGDFLIENVEAGTYLLRTNFIGYKTQIRKIEVKEEEDKPMHIRLSADKEMLEEVKVLAAATPVSVKEDTLVYNAEAFRVTNGAMLEDLVKKLPGAELSQDGKLTVNGKEIKKVLVDGKEFFSDDPKVSLKNLPANIVENVKTYNKKSDNAALTGIDDDDDEAVLDLTVKKGMKKGWIGNFTGGAGHDLYEEHPDFRYGLDANLSRFTDDRNFSIIGSLNNINNTGFSDRAGSYSNQSRGMSNGINTSSLLGVTFAQNKSNSFEYGGNVQYRHNKNESEQESKSETFRKSGSTYKDERSTSWRKTDDVSTNFRFRWKPDSLTNILLRPSFSYGHTYSEGQSSTQNYNTSRFMNNEKEMSKTTESNKFNMDITLRFVRKLNSQGRNVAFNSGFTYSYNPSEQNSNSTTHFYTEEENEEMETAVSDSLVQQNRYTDKCSHNRTFFVEASYTEPVFRNHYLQFKYRYQHRGSDSYAYVYDEEDHSDYIDSLSSKIDNGYNNHQIDASLQGKYTKLSYNVGITLQPQQSNTHNLVGPNVGKDKRQSVFNFSPNLMLRIKFDKQSNLSFRYRGQSAAPDVEYLQEVIDESDPLNLLYGNPDLKPTYTHNASVWFKKYIAEKQQNWMANLSFRLVQNAIMNRLQYDETTGAQRNYKENVNGNWNINTSLTFSMPFRNTPFSFSSTTNGGYTEDVSLEGSVLETDYSSLKSLTQTGNVAERMALSYRNDHFDISLSGKVNYQKSHNEQRQSGNRETMDYEARLDANFNLPWSIILSSDLSYRYYDGYQDGFDNHELIWNAQIAKSFLKNNSATIRFKVLDLLGKQNNLSRKVSESAIVDTRYNSLGSYFLLQFSYKLNNFQQKEGDKGEQRRSDVLFFHK